MKYRVYIQALNNFPIADWAVSAYQGFRDKQMDIIFFEDIEEVPVSRNNIVVAYIEDTNKYFKKLGLPEKQALNIPKELMSYTGRTISYCTMKDFRLFGSQANNLPIFIKPNGRSKEFVAGVMSKTETISSFNEISDDRPVLLSEVVDFKSEYRGYVINGKLQGLYFYRGDFRIFPDVNIIDSAIDDYKSAPAGYSIDFGVTDKGQTLLIECNDGWSLGNYGLNHSIYANLLLTRWLEIMKNNLES